MNYLSCFKRTLLHSPRSVLKNFQQFEMCIQLKRKLENFCFFSLALSTIKY